MRRDGRAPGLDEQETSMSDLAVLTKAGRKSVEQEMEMLAFLSGKWGVSYVLTSKIGAAHIDGLFVRNGIIAAAFESKCRTKWDDYDSLLITATKIDDGVAVSSVLFIPFLVLAYIVPLQQILYWQVTDSSGDIQFPITRRVTGTQATIEGGEARRLNAFLPLEFANIIRMERDGNESM
jgi:hypothetical protein